MFGNRIQIQLFVFEYKKMVGMGSIFLVWPLFSAFVLQSFYCLNTTPMLKYENNLEVISLELNMYWWQFCSEQ
jgi:hypothetical protein